VQACCIQRCVAPCHSALSRCLLPPSSKLQPRTILYICWQRLGMVVRGPNKSTSRPRYGVSARSVQWRAAPPRVQYHPPLCYCCAIFKFERLYSPSGVNALAYASAARTKHTPAKAACASPFHVAARRSGAGSTRLCSLLHPRSLRLFSILRSSREYQLGLRAELRQCVRRG